MIRYLKELQRRNVFRAVAAYVVLGWILLQVAGGLEEALSLPAWFDTIIAALLAIGLPVVIIVSWVYEITPEGLQKTRNIADHQSITADTGRRLNYITMAGVVVLLGVVIADRYSSQPQQDSASDPSAENAAIVTPTEEQSIAVLPFVAMTASQDDEFFADGLSEEILNVLAQIEGLKVAGRTSAFYYKGRNEDLRNIAAAMSPEARLLIIERLLPQTISSDAGLVEGDLNMLCLSGGVERTLDEYRAILELAGLRLFACRAIQPSAGFFAIEADFY